MLYCIFRTIRCTYNPLIFSKMKYAPYSPVLLMCGSDCNLSPSSEQIYVVISAINAIVSTATCSLRANFLLLSCNQIIYSHSLYECVFFFIYSHSPKSVFFSSPYVHKHTRASRMYCNMYKATSRKLLEVQIKCIEFLFY